jgi:hypothetical protein
MRKTLLAFVVAFFVATVSLAVPVEADVLDSISVTVACKDYTVKVTGHALTHTNASVQYTWSLPLGSLGPGLAGAYTTDKLQVSPKADGTFTGSATKPQAFPPFDPTFGIGFGSGTLVTGSMNWNTVSVTFIGISFTECPGLNRCPLTPKQWLKRQNWPVGQLIVGNPFGSPPLVYSEAGARNILRMAPASDASINLARQLIASKLNFFFGTPRIVFTTLTPTGVLLMLVEADYSDVLLDTGALPLRIDPTSSLGQTMVSEADLLYNYNSGAMVTHNPDGTCVGEFPGF